MSIHIFKKIYKILYITIYCTTSFNIDYIYKVLYNKNKTNGGFNMGKTPEYTKKAINNYRDKFDFIQIRFPKGTRQRLEAAEIGNINDYVVDCVLKSLGDISAETEEIQDPTPDTEAAEIAPVEPETPESTNPLLDAETPENVLKPLTIEDIQAMLDNRKADEIRREKERQERKEQEEQERRKLLANPEYAATYAQLMEMETAEKEKKRAETLTRARLETI